MALSPASCQKCRGGEQEGTQEGEDQDVWIGRLCLCLVLSSFLFASSFLRTHSEIRGGFKLSVLCVNTAIPILYM